jgi:hypothetical protein
MIEVCDIYFTCMHYQNQSWLEDPDILLQQVYDNLNEINTFHFSSISINMAQVYNVSLKQTNYDSMVMFLKCVRFNGIQFFNVDIILKLIASIKKQLSFIEGLYFENIDVKCSSSFSDRELGILAPFKSVSKPTILEQTKNSSR